MEKPDFEKLAIESTDYCQEGNHSHDCGCGAFEEGCEKIWTDYVVPMQEELKRWHDGSEHISRGFIKNDWSDKDDQIKSLQEELEKEKANFSKG